VNLVEMHPKKVNEMEDLLNEYKKNVVKPFFPPSESKANPENWGDKY
jgi:hypothetical protein